MSLLVKIIKMSLDFQSNGNRFQISICEIYTSLSTYIFILSRVFQFEFKFSFNSFIFYLFHINFLFYILFLGNTTSTCSLESIVRNGVYQNKFYFIIIHEKYSRKSTTVIHKPFTDIKPVGKKSNFAKYQIYLIH